MSRKAKQAAKRALLEAGAIEIRWFNGGRHKIVTALFGDGSTLDIGFHFGQVDDVMVKKIIKTRLLGMMRS